MPLTNTGVALLCCEILRQGGAEVLQQAARSNATGEITTVKAVVDHCERELRANESGALPESFDFDGSSIALDALLGATCGALFGAREDLGGLPAVAVEGVVGIVAPVPRCMIFGVTDPARNAALVRNRALRDTLETLVKAHGGITLWDAAPSVQEVAERLTKTLEHWTDVTIKDADGTWVPMGDNVKRRRLMARYRRAGSLSGYYLGDEDAKADGYDGSTAGPGVHEIDWTGF